MSPDALLSSHARPDALDPVPARVTLFDDIHDLRTVWDDLSGPTGNVFSTWEWADVWCKHFGTRRQIRIAGVHMRGEPVLLLPTTVERRRGMQLLRFIGYGPADQLGPVGASSDSAAAVAAIEHLMSDGSVLVAERITADANWLTHVAGRTLSTESSPVINLEAEGDWNAYLTARSSNFRQQVRRRDRKLRRGLGVSFRLVDDPSRLPHEFDILIALHEARWGAASRAFAGPRRAFHHAFAERALERGWLRLWIAEADGEPVAAWYGFRFGGVESYYQSGRAPGWDRFAVGAGILEHSIREAFADGMREYRLLRGGESYKQRYASNDVGLITVAAARRPIGRAVVAAVSLIGSSSRGRRLLKASR